LSKSQNRKKERHMAKEKKDREKKAWSTPIVKELEVTGTEGTVDLGDDNGHAS
jgi:hypothetical protein